MERRTRGNKDVKLPKVQKVECTLEYKNFEGLILAIIIKYRMILKFAFESHNAIIDYYLGSTYMGRQKYKFKIKPIIKIEREKNGI